MYIAPNHVCLMRQPHLSIESYTKTLFKVYFISKVAQCWLQALETAVHIKNLNSFKFDKE